MKKKTTFERGNEALNKKSETDCSFFSTILYPRVLICLYTQPFSLSCSLDTHSTM